MPAVVGVTLGLEGLLAIVGQGVVAQGMAATGAGTGLAAQSAAPLQTVEGGIEGADIQVEVTASEVAQLVGEVQAIALLSGEKSKERECEVAVVERYTSI